MQVHPICGACAKHQIECKYPQSSPKVKAASPVQMASPSSSSEPLTFNEPPKAQQKSPEVTPAAQVPRIERTQTSSLIEVGNGSRYVDNIFWANVNIAVRLQGCFGSHSELIDPRNFTTTPYSRVSQFSHSTLSRGTLVIRARGPTHHQRSLLL
jgi:hypothetical protein